jgi:trehalose 6-phosphate phosphatase
MASNGLPGFTPVTAEGTAGLDALLTHPAQALIALDFDGTLSPIVADPAQARVLPQALDGLRALTPLVGAIAVITGRPAGIAVEYGSLDQVPGIIVLGQYGRQRWQDGELTAPSPPAGLAKARERLPAVLAEARAPVGTWIEDKTDALAVHTRRTADPAAALDLVRAPLLRLAQETGLRGEPGRMVIELRPDGADKGKTLKALAAERVRSAIMFCGDDLGDRPAFAALAERASRPPAFAAVRVAVANPEGDPLNGVSDLVLDRPDEVPGLVRRLLR